jgi:hypothetical protein
MHAMPPSLLSWASTIAWGLLFFVPTMIQPFCQRKAFKIISRTFLGIAMVVLCYGGLLVLPFSVAGNLLRIVFVLVFFITYKLTCLYRNKLTPPPEKKCGASCYPFCSGNRGHLTRVYKSLTERAEENDPLVQFAKQLIESSDGEFSTAQHRGVQTSERIKKSFHP